LWNAGGKENETQSQYSALIFMFLWGILLGKNRKNMTGELHQQM
jgi:hypothetical protein